MSKRTHRSPKGAARQRRCRVAVPATLTREQFLEGCAELRRRFDAGALAEPVPTTRRELFELHRRLVREAAEVMRAKNGRYATADDALLNYRQARAAGVTAAQGIVARLSDKHGRLLLVAKGAAKLDLEDVRDAINILVQFAAACIERGDLR